MDVRDGGGLPALEDLGADHHPGAVADAAGRLAGRLHAADELLRLRIGAEDIGISAAAGQDHRVVVDDLRLSR